MNAPTLFELPAPVVVERIGQALAAVPRGALRSAFLQERIKDAPPAVAVRVVACAMREAVRGVNDARVLVETFGDLMRSAHFDKAYQAAMLTCAVMLQENDVVMLMAPTGANDDSSDAQLPSAKAKRGSLAGEETLGRRKTLARTVTGDVLLRVLADPHPDVIKHAMQNPHVTEAHAVRVAARRTVVPALLEAVAASRFGNRHDVRRALVMNPTTPPRLACQLVVTMTAADIKDVAQAPGLSAALMAVVRGLLKG